MAKVVAGEEETRAARINPVRFMEVGRDMLGFVSKGMKRV